MKNISIIASVIAALLLTLSGASSLRRRYTGSDVKANIISASAESPEKRTKEKSDKDSKDSDTKDKESKDKNSKEKDSKDKGSKAKKSKDKNSKDKKSKDKSSSSEKKDTDSKAEEDKNQDLPKIAKDLQFFDVDGEGNNFTFLYDGKIFNAEYTPDNWKITDSYKISVKDDMIMICEALSEIHPIHGIDGESFRTPDDMASEWIQHNIAYHLLSEDDPWKEHAKDVDLNPDDQNKSIYEMYRTRTAEEVY